ncbi:hypothetical protein Naga_101266g2 [Nannochloropsis gaditana]|uniref:Uncharacterized protein n=1 Tax=Nannochloropsis gaditana TaxID=72520 RepID=W7T4N7_9STRA|nr:hypothetical protein Naga_101266g2 [Nannochloropsis gaditana]
MRLLCEEVGPKRSIGQASGQKPGNACCRAYKLVQQPPTSMSQGMFTNMHYAFLSDKGKRRHHEYDDDKEYDDDVVHTLPPGAKVYCLS